MNLNEAKNLDIYTKILNAFVQFIDWNPMTGMYKIYKQFLDAGLKCIPKDKRALEILDNVLSGSAPKSIQDLINTNFSELPLFVRPIYKKGNSKLTAFWKKDDKIYNKVFDLVKLNGGASVGKWVDEQGEPVDLLDLSREG